MMLLFSLLLSIGLLVLALAAADGDGEGMFIGADWIKASLKNLGECVSAVPIETQLSGHYRR